MLRQSMGEVRPMDADASNATPAGLPAALERRNGVFGDPALRERTLNIALPVIAMIGLLLVWSAAVNAFAIPDYLLPAPLDVIRRMMRDWQVLARNGLYTLESVLIGFCAGV